MAIFDKTALVAGAGALLLVAGGSDVAFYAWLLAGTVGAFLVEALRERRWVIALPVALVVASCIAAAALPALSLAAYDLVRAGIERGGRRRLLAAAPLVPLLVHSGAGSDIALLHLGVAALFVVLAAILAVRTNQEEMLRADFHATRDDLRQSVDELKRANAELIDARDYETNAVALAERTRIARDIHDGVGHRLTGLLLHVKALEVVHRDDPAVLEGLGALSMGLSDSLDVMRRSVHALSDSGEDLAISLNALATSCGIASVDVVYELDEAPPTRVSRAITAVVREALTNAARHAHAPTARVRVSDFPAFWRVVIDNDEGESGFVPRDSACEPAPVVEGLGLRSMRDRVESLGGTLRITPAPRFTVHATIPKENA